MVKKRRGSAFARLSPDAKPRERMATLGTARGMRPDEGGLGRQPAGEGRLDGQSVRGKVVAGVAKRAKQAGVPVVAVVGAVGDGADGIYDLGVCGVFSVNHAPEPFEVSRLRSRENLGRTMRNIMGLLRAASTGE